MSYHQQSFSSPTMVVVNSPSSFNCSSTTSNNCSNGESNSCTSPANNVRPLSINMKDHCILCLESEEPSIIEEILTTNPKSILNFQPLVYYLTAIDPTNSDRDQKTRLLDSRKYFPVIGNLPPMCTQCYEILGEMYRLHLELVDIQVKIQRQIALARRIVKYTIKEERKCGRLSTVRSKFFNELGTGMRCVLTREEIDGLRYFLENFHGLIIEAENKYIFPCPPPPPDPNSKSPQAPPPPPTALMTFSYPVRFTSSSSAASPLSSSSSQIVYQQQNQNYQRQLYPDISSIEAPVPVNLLNNVRNSSVSSPTSSDIFSAEANKRTKNSEMIVVSGIDHNLKFEVEDEEVEGDEEDEQDVKCVVLIKEDLEDDQGEENEEENGPDREYQNLIIEPVEDNECIHPDQQQQKIISNNKSDGIHLEERSRSPVFPSSPHIWQVQTQPCDVCNKTYHILNLPNHMKDHFGRREVWTCDICHQVYLSRSKMILHFQEFNTGSYCREHSQWYRNLTHYCTVCSSQFPTEAFLHHHIFSYHETDHNIESIYSCKMCCRKFRTEQALDFHFITHMHKSQRRKYWKLLQHLAPPSNNIGIAAAVSSNRSTTGGHANTCSSTSTSNMNATISTATAPPNNTVAAFFASAEPDDYSCEICGKKCVGSTSLLRHVKEVHKQQGKRKHQHELSTKEHVNKAARNE